jgi:glycosyltransferase involved in cell wall biosynthesis
VRVLFLNDLGFQYGAGVGHARQIQSVLLGGHEVAAVCGADGLIPDEMLLTRHEGRDGWHGMTALTGLFRSSSHTETELLDGVLMAVFYPDVVIVGNLHGAGWPLAIVPELSRLGCRVVAYLHDLHLVTGRCVYPGQCTKYLTGCDDACPTPAEYPQLEPSRIADAWRRRRTLFQDRPGLTLATNSNFMRNVVQAALPQASVRTVYLGADTQLFKPGDKCAARRALGIADDRPVVLTGAVNLTDRRKGAHHLERIIGRLGNRAHFLAFGHPSGSLPALRSLGFNADPRAIAAAYQASDVFVGTATEEAFGQTTLEAALCGAAVAAFGVGGLPEIIQSNRTGLLVPAGDAEALGDAVGELIRDAALRARLAGAARVDCAARFSLEQQSQNWAPLLDGSDVPDLEAA